MFFPYQDRLHGGRVLASHLSAYGNGRSMVLGLPRGGVAVAYEVALALNAPLDVMTVRKIGAPDQREFALGAIASGGIGLLREGVSSQALQEILEEEEQNLARSERRFRGGRPFPDITGKTVLLIDDGLATGASMRAAVAAAKIRSPARLVVAVPVGSKEACAELKLEVDEVVCPLIPENFEAVGQWYVDFSQSTDEEVLRYLRQAEQRSLPAPFQ